MWWELNVYPLLFQTYWMSSLHHIENFSQFVLQESLSVSSQSNKFNFLKLVRTSKERGKVPREKQPPKSSVRNLGRAPSSTSGNSTRLEKLHIRKFIRAGKAPLHVKDLGRYSKLSKCHKSSSWSCKNQYGISAGRVSTFWSANHRTLSFVSTDILWGSSTTRSVSPEMLSSVRATNPHMSSNKAPMVGYTWPKDSALAMPDAKCSAHVKFWQAAVCNTCNDVRPTTPEGRYFNLQQSGTIRHFNTCSFLTASGKISRLSQEDRSRETKSLRSPSSSGRFQISPPLWSRTLSFGKLLKKLPGTNCIGFPPSSRDTNLGAQNLSSTCSSAMIVSKLSILLPTLGGILPKFDLLNKDKAVLQGVCHYPFPVCRKPNLSSHHVPWTSINPLHLNQPLHVTQWMIAPTTYLTRKMHLL